MSRRGKTRVGGFSGLELPVVPLHVSSFSSGYYLLVLLICSTYHPFRTYRVVNCCSEYTDWSCEYQPPWTS